MARLHAWFLASRMKGNMLCRLPGVAVTCIAVVLGSQCSDALGDCLMRILQLLRERLCTATPCLRLEEVEQGGERPARSSEGRPLTAFEVYVCEQNLAQRHSLLCTRHLLDMVAFSCSLGGDAVLSPDRYAAWRRRHMFRAAKLCPRHASAMARTLHVAVAHLAKHPLLDSVFVDEEGAAITIRCTLARVTDQRYEMRAGDGVVRCAGEYAYVGRGSKVTMPLLITQGMDLASAATAGVGLPIAAGDGVVPNAPTLTTDVSLQFPREDWDAHHSSSSMIA